MCGALSSKEHIDQDHSILNQNPWSAIHLHVLTETSLHAAYGSVLPAAEISCLNKGNSISEIKFNLLITGRMFGGKKGEPSIQGSPQDRYLCKVIEFCSFFKQSFIFCCRSHFVNNGFCVTCKLVYHSRLKRWDKNEKRKEESEGSNIPEYSVKAMNILHVGLWLE